MQLGIGHRAFFRHHRLGEIGERGQFGIVEGGRINGARCFNRLLGQQFFQSCQLGVAGHAEAAFVGARGDNLHHFHFAGGQAVGAVELADFLVKRQRFGRIGQHADQVGDKAVGIQRGFYARFGAFGSGFDGMDGQACHDVFLSGVCWNRMLRAAASGARNSINAAAAGERFCASE